mmetsp:Transcript_8770/g.11039  ORF Transcript_8770/g.11039 Transcript_8770/m.11039 type:complete len:83 (+) Transcript_8770:398-646(+)
MKSFDIKSKPYIWCHVVLKLIQRKSRYIHGNSNRAKKNGYNCYEYKILRNIIKNMSVAHCKLENVRCFKSSLQEVTSTGNIG